MDAIPQIFPQPLIVLKKADPKLMDFPTRRKRQGVARTDASQADPGSWCLETLQRFPASSVWQ